MNPHTTLTFLGVAGVIIVTPGPDTALTVRNTLRGDRAAGIATAAGVAFGQLLWAAGAALGIAAALAASAIAACASKYLGAGYLCALGCVSGWHAMQRHRSELGAASPTSRDRITPRAAALQGVLSNLANPKMAAFFTALLPPFAAHGPHPLVTMMALGATFAVMTFGWLSGYATVAARAHLLLRRDAVRRVAEIACAVVFVGLGARIATDGQPG